MKQKLLRLTAMLMFSCMVASSIPTGMALAEENVQADSSAEAVQEQGEAEAEENADAAQNSGQDSADSSDETTQQTTDSGSQNDPQTDSQPASGSESSGGSTSAENESSVSGTAEENSAPAEETAESREAKEAQPQDDASEDSEAEAEGQSQEDSVIEKNANEINYVFVESPYLETPGTERIAVSYGDGSETVSDATLTVRDDEGQETVWELSVSAGQVYLFTYDFSDESSTGTYEVVSLNVTDEEGEKNILLSDSGMEANFGVNEEYSGIEELTPLDADAAEEAAVEESAEVEATVAEIDPNNVEESVEQITDALQEAEAQTDTSDLSASIGENSSVSGRTASKSVSGNAASLMSVLGAKLQTAVAANARSGNGNVVVALDPGHDSKHTGASSNGLKEEVLTLKIAQYCKAELETYSGVTVYMTRTTAACPYPNNSSSGGDIGDRVIAAANAGADIFVSIHLNSSTSSSANGAEVIIPNSNWKPQVAQEGRELAQAILKELQAVGLNLRPNEIYSKDTTIGETYEDGSTSDYFAVQIYAKEAGIPGIIVEHAFLTNSGDRAHLDSEADLKELGVADATGIAKYLGLSKGEWRTEGGKKCYYVNGNKVTGAYRIGTSWYYFDPDNGGAMYTGWRQDGDKTYYYDENGVLALGAKKIGSYWYYFNGNGAMHTGWRQDGDKTYYYDAEGHLVQRDTVIDGITYYFASNGVMTGKQQVGPTKIDNYWYYFNADGSRYIGWRQDGNKTYYYDAEGRLAQGVNKIDGYWYYFNSNGTMYTGWRQDGDKTYYYNAEGHLAQGKTDIDGKKYYFNGNGTLMAPGTVKVGLYWYFVQNDGSLFVGWRHNDGNTYYYDSEGRLAQQPTVIDGTTYYFNGNGTMVVQGPEKIGSYWYYINGDGSRYVGWRTDYKGTYYYDSEGRLAQGVKKIENYWYYFNGNGTMYTGWRQDGDKTYYYDSQGRLAQGNTKIGNYWHHFNGNGSMYTGWRVSGSQTYYYQSDGHLAIGTTSVDGNEYYFQSNGAMLVNAFMNHRYYGSNGARVAESSYGSIFYKIEGSSTTTVDQMVRFYEEYSPIDYPSEELKKGGAATIRDLAQIFYEEASAEGIKAEVVWAQTMLETGYLKYGGQVKISQFNFAGLGATDGGAAGASFSDVRTGVRAQVQHMKAYATTSALKNSCVDPRFNLVTRGSAQYVEILGQQENPNGYGWATGANYGLNIKGMIDKIKRS